MAKRKKVSIPELWVVFDTNAIYTGSASYLLRKEAVDVIKENSAHPDLRVRWILPSVVQHERQFQMTKQAKDFLPTVQKLERLLGHNLNIAPDILEMRVREAAERSINELKLEIEELRPTVPDWNRLILDAAYRRPPFDAGPTEKGFRDAVILETFVQIVNGAPQSPKSCRLALVSGDGLLTDAATARTKQAANVRIFSTIEELKGFINTLVSQVDEEFVAALMPQASKLFFVVKDADTIYYTEKISTRITERVGTDIGALPASAERFETKGFLVASPQFVRKERQHIHWSSRVEVKLSATKSASVTVNTPWEPSTLSSFKELLSNPSSAAPSKVTIEGAPTGDFLANLWKPSTNLSFTSDVFSTASPVTVSVGRAAYDVHWSTTISTARKLTRPQVDKVQFVEVRWGTD